MVAGIESDVHTAKQTMSLGLGRHLVLHRKLEHLEDVLERNGAARRRARCLLGLAVLLLLRLTVLLLLRLAVLLAVLLLLLRGLAVATSSDGRRRTRRRRVARLCACQRDKSDTVFDVEEERGKAYEAAGWRAEAAVPTAERTDPGPGREAGHSLHDVRERCVNVLDLITRRYIRWVELAGVVAGSSDRSGATEPCPFPARSTGPRRLCLYTTGRRSDTSQRVRSDASSAASWVDSPLFPEPLSRLASPRPRRGAGPVASDIKSRSSIAYHRREAVVRTPAAAAAERAERRHTVPIEVSAERRREEAERQLQLGRRRVCQRDPCSVTC